MIDPMFFTAAKLRSLYLFISTSIAYCCVFNLKLLYSLSTGMLVWDATLLRCDRRRKQSVETEHAAAHSVTGSK